MTVDRIGPVSDTDRELRERMELIERLAHAIADPACEYCDGAGMCDEGAEWSLCDCAQSQLGETEASYRWVNG